MALEAQGFLLIYQLSGAHIETFTVSRHFRYRAYDLIPVTDDIALVPHGEPR